MIKVILAFLILFTLKINAEEKLDSIFLNKPEPLDKFDFTFPEYKLDFLSNGVKLYLIHDDRQEITNLRLLIGGGSSQDGKLAGLSEITANMLLKGTKTLSAEQLSEKIDFYGASIYASSNDDYIVLNITTLSKYLNEVLDLTNKVLFEPKFDKKELEKLKKQYKAALISEKSDPSSLASKLSKKVIYGNNHEYSNFPTNATIENITIKDVENFYKNHLYSNNMSLAIFGFYNDKDLSNIYNIFNKFKKKEDFALKTVSETKSLAKGVYFIERESSVQSAVRIIAKGVDFANDEYELLSLNSNIVGSSFTGRLFKILREKYSYTYSPSAIVTSRKYTNYFSANADVKAEVTDSSITVMKSLISTLATEGISNEELDAIKKYRIGNYLMSFENSDFTTTLIQNGEFKGVRAKTYETFTKRLNNYKQKDIRESAAKFLKESDLYVIVVGPASVKEKLKQFGNVFEFDKDIKPISDFEKISLDHEDILEKYIDAVGGDKVFKEIKTLQANGNIVVNANGQEISGKYESYSKSPNKKYTSQDIAQTKQETWINGNETTISVSGMVQNNKTNEFELYDIMPFYLFKMEDSDLKFTVLGKRNNEIHLKVNNKEEERVFKFDAMTYLLKSYNTSQESPMGTIVLDVNYNNYKLFGKYKLPTQIENISSIFTSSLELDYKINPELEDSIFTPSK